MKKWRAEAVVAENYAYDEIAQRYGITVKAVEYRMSRALALCQEALRD